MGISERKEREKAEMRELILSTAAEIFLDNGFEKTSIRNIAEAIEYSPATIYLYFKDKNDLFFALSEEGFRRFFEHLKRIPQDVPPIEKLRHLGSLYLEFALNNPAYYDLMFILRAPMATEENEVSWNLGKKNHEVLTNLVDECLAHGHFKGQNPDQVAFMLWSFVHGLVSFRIRDRMKMYDPTKHDEITNGAFDMFQGMLRNA
ncbi:MAG: TetR/AcrR family transcriptional regulator [Tunicatimonas sp.]